MDYHSLIKRWTALPAQDLLDEIFTSYGTRAALGTSFQKTGLVAIDLLSRHRQDFRVFTIDTGRLFPETHAYMQAISERYRLALEVFSSDANDVADLLATSPYGEYLFLESAALRQECCYVRKVLPRNKALRTLDVWLTGVRKDQSSFRGTLRKVEVIEFEGRPILKVMPLFDWTQEQIDDYIRKRDLPVHPLYAKGFATIGCQAPCTTPSLPGEAPRNGRWRWEKSGLKECSLHLDKFDDGAGI
ncbi:phosphoadenylylsulfate reductase (Thioredoxin) [Candidatus Moduliflexus flocculans]|uniref:Adenosine 5'-phosphosulfate reductase n=1 Tax=Candidatus Moduliflexus flocculans TaxID=1499966 RepID=A0A0S6VQH7_9BACT|nr:phosphoadenylylsulfate reductase (Thioredoxin) [Candidatus Moduliflexus flocculans]